MSFSANFCKRGESFMDFQRVIVIDLASLGIGEASDANRYHSIGTDTLGHVAIRVGNRLKLPTLGRLGLGNIRFGNPVNGLPPVDQPLGFYGKIHLEGLSNSPEGGIREMLDYQDGIRVTSVIDPIVKYSDDYARSIMITDYKSYISNQNLADIVAVNKDSLAFQTLHHEVISPVKGLIYMSVQGLPRAAENGSVDQYLEILRETDQHIAQVINEMSRTDLLIITATFANDMTAAVSPTREYLPLIAYRPSNEDGRALGIRHSLADIGATIAEAFSLSYSKESVGHSFLGELLS
ncbi:phosphopentomutase [Lentilactobacillus hilgardii]|uniref:Phosphopentomutase n=2 Tax=Lentilactobacillus hilgardii TaxID=1588 RepID=A0A6P1E2M3_LENHI|nr:phosphopentomutase [Lentilactobacillus hilgardii]